MARLVRHDETGPYEIPEGTELPAWTKLISAAIANKPNTAAAANPTITSDDMPMWSRWRPSTRPAPAIIGVAIMKEKLAASSRVIPTIRAVVIVEPERETPGMIA